MPEAELKKWQDTRLAERAVQMVHSAIARKIINRLILKTQNGTLGKPDPVADKMLDENMQVRIGDEIHNHPTAAAAPPQSGKSLSFAKKMAVATALAVGLFGTGGIAGTWLAGAVDRPDVPAAVDTDTRYELRIGGGK